MLTGYPPFREKNIVRLLKKHIEEMPDFVETEIPPEIIPIVSKALAKNKEDRFQSAKEFKECLKDMGYKAEVPYV